LGAREAGSYGVLARTSVFRKAIKFHWDLNENCREALSSKPICLQSRTASLARDQRKRAATALRSQ
jgi:hypothetical protein